MLPYIGDCYSCVGISVQNLLDKVSTSFRNETREKVVATQDFLVEFACIWVFKRQVAAGHSVENDAARPDVRIQAVISLPCYHLWSSVARRTASSFEQLSLLVSVRKAEINYLDVLVLV